MCNSQRRAYMFAIIIATTLPTSAADDLFSEQVAPVLQRRCLSCHHDGESKGDFSLSTSAGLIESGYIDTDDVDASYLLELVTPHNGKAEMPKDSASLSSAEVESLRRWIAEGANWPEDKVYARFVQEQVAVDVLFPEDPDGVLGLGFLAAGPWDFIGHWEVGEGKLDGRIAKHLDRDEMISAAFNVSMSTTIPCAQCHHHKFDPIRMEDYYRLHAVFAAIDRADRVYEGLPNSEQQRKNHIVAEINRIKAEQEALTTTVQREVAAKASGIDRRIATLTEKYGTETELRPQYGYHSQATKNPNEPKWFFGDFSGMTPDNEVLKALLRW